MSPLHQSRPLPQHISTSQFSFSEIPPQPLSHRVQSYSSSFPTLPLHWHDHRYVTVPAIEPHRSTAEKELYFHFLPPATHPTLFALPTTALYGDISPQELLFYRFFLS